METLPITGMLSDRPRGLVYEPEFLTHPEEAQLLRTLTDLPFDPIVIRGQAARRSARHSASATTTEHDNLNQASHFQTGLSHRETVAPLWPG
jgi:hypothetical protein